jgi:hypothetical protein
MCAPRVTRHTSIRHSSSCHTRVNMGASILFTAAMIRAFRSARPCGNATWPRCGCRHGSLQQWRVSMHHVDACVARTWISYRCVPCHPWCTHRTCLIVKKKILFQFSRGCEQFHEGGSFGFLVINVCNNGEHYETPRIERKSWAMAQAVCRWPLSMEIWLLSHARTRAIRDQYIVKKSSFSWIVWPWKI